ncbi:MAG: hypothetical protein ACP5G1_02595 [Nanopusillaceae archaeon]
MVISLTLDDLIRNNHYYSKNNEVKRKGDITFGYIKETVDRNSIIKNNADNVILVVKTPKIDEYARSHFFLKSLYHEPGGEPSDIYYLKSSVEYIGKLGKELTPYAIIELNREDLEYITYAPEGKYIANIGYLGIRKPKELLSKLSKMYMNKDAEVGTEDIRKFLKYMKEELEYSMYSIDKTDDLIDIVRKIIIKWIEQNTEGNKYIML